MLTPMAPTPDDGLPRRLFNGTATGPYADEMDIDWQAKGAVTEVKTQGSCESCYSFATTGSVEGISFIKNNKLLDLSEQMIVSCDTLDNGCGTGLMDNAYKWINSVGGLCSETDYPRRPCVRVLRESTPRQRENASRYVSGDGTVPACDNTKCSVQPNTLVTNAVDVPPNEPMLATSILQQPIAVGIDATCEEQRPTTGVCFETKPVGNPDNIDPVVGARRGDDALLDGHLRDGLWS